MGSLGSLTSWDRTRRGHGRWRGQHAPGGDLLSYQHHLRIPAGGWQNPILIIRSTWSDGMGRAGRGGQPSVCIFLHGKTKDCPRRPFLKGDRAVCLRKALVDIFPLTDIDGWCLFGNISEACLLEGRCVCSKCRFNHLQTELWLVSLHMLS